MVAWLAVIYLQRHTGLEYLDVRLDLVFILNWREGLTAEVPFAKGSLLFVHKFVVQVEISLSAVLAST